MNLKSRVIAINKLLTDIYQREIRLSYLLAELDFNREDIELINHEFLPNVVDIFLKILEETVINFQDGTRQFKILQDTYSLHGDRSKTLIQVTEELNISHEPVRQIKEKSIKKLVSKNNKSLLESTFKQEIKELLENYNNCDRDYTEYINTPRKYIFKSSLLPTGEKCLSISEGNNKIIIAESNFKEFYRNLLNNIKISKSNQFKTYKIEDIRKKHQTAYEKWTE